MRLHKCRNSKNPKGSLGLEAEARGALSSKSAPQIRKILSKNLKSRGPGDVPPQQKICLASKRFNTWYQNQNKIKKANSVHPGLRFIVSSNFKFLSIALRNIYTTKDCNPESVSTEPLQSRSGTHLTTPQLVPGSGLEPKGLRFFQHASTSQVHDPG